MSKSINRRGFSALALSTSFALTTKASWGNAALTPD